MVFLHWWNSPHNHHKSFHQCLAAVAVIPVAVVVALVEVDVFLEATVVVSGADDVVVTVVLVGVKSRQRYQPWGVKWEGDTAVNN